MSTQAHSVSFYTLSLQVKTAEMLKTVEHVMLQIILKYSYSFYKGAPGKKKIIIATYYLSIILLFKMFW